MNKDLEGSAGLVIILIIVVLAIAGGFWYYVAHNNGSAPTTSSQNTPTTTNAEDIISGFQSSAGDLNYKIENATSGDLLWFNQGGPAVDVHVQNGLTFDALPIAASTSPEINYASTSPEIASSLNPALINSINDYMNLHGFTLQADQSSNEAHPLILNFSFSNAYYNAQAGVRCRLEVWLNAGPDGLALDDPYKGNLFCADQATYQDALNDELPFIKGLSLGTSTVVSDYQICSSDPTKAIVAIEGFINGDGIYYVAMENTSQGWKNMNLAPAQMGSRGCF
jgi:hypothetical protein